MRTKRIQGKIKYSYRFYVLNVCIISKKIKTLLIENGLDNNSIYDRSIYDKNKVLLLPLTTKKADDMKVPSLIPIDCDIFDCCASYIKEDYEDWDIKFQTDKPVQPVEKLIDIELNDNYFISN